MPRIEIVFTSEISDDQGGGGYYEGYTFSSDGDGDASVNEYISSLGDEEDGDCNGGPVAKPVARRDPGPPRSIRHQSKHGHGRLDEDYQARFEDQKMSGELFEDPDFPADNSSLYPSRGYSHIEWKRPRDLCADPMFISDGASRFDVRQGELGDCWLLAAIASLSMHRELFDRVVPIDQDFGDDYCGMFRFRFWQAGEWRNVVIDDQLPTKNGRLCFMKSADRNEFWSALLEKAYAKLNGSYEALEGGNQSEAMEDFTGGLCENFDLQNSPDNLFQILARAAKSQSLMGCSIESDQIEGILDNGLITGHAYSVTDARVCNLEDGSAEQLVRVRNPWGNEYEWKGDWSDDSDKWQLVSDDDKLEMEIREKDDGEFWMSFDDFIREFTKLEVCHLSPESMANVEGGDTAAKRRWELCIESGAWKPCISAGGCRNYIDTFHTNPQFLVEIVDPDEDDEEDLGTIIVGLMQKDMRKLTKGGDFLSIGYAIYQLKSPDVGPLDQRFFRFNRQAAKSPSFINQREICSRHKLPPGHYAIIPSTFEPNEEAEFILRIFSEKPNNSAELDTEDAVEDVVQAVYGRKQQASVMSNEEPLRKAFGEFAGPASKIHAKQLQQILNRSLGKELKQFDGFSLEACRSMLALVDANMSGFMEFDEFKRLWNEVRLLKTIFKDHDLDGNGYFDTCELREALRMGGYNLSNKVFEAIAMRYMDPEKGTVTFEDFILVSVRLKIAFETFQSMPKTKEDYGVIRRDHFLLQTLYL